MAFDDWDEAEKELYSHLTENSDAAYNDDLGAELFHETFFGGNSGSAYESVYNDFETYMWEEYGIEVLLEMDWEGYRDAYDAQ